MVTYWQNFPLCTYILPVKQIGTLTKATTNKKKLS